MPTSVPTNDEFQALVVRLDTFEARLIVQQGEIDALDERLTALEDGGRPDRPPRPEPPAGTMQVEVEVGGGRYFFDEVDAQGLGDYFDPDHRFVMSCARATHPELPDYRVDFRRIDGWACVVCDYGNGLTTTEPTNLPAHTVSITDDAGVVHHNDLPAHYHAARWRWQSGKWPHMREVPDLLARNWLPILDAAVNRETAGFLPVPQYSPMGLAGFNPNMPDTGGRADIGFVTDWQGEWLCTAALEMLEGILAQGEAGGTVPFHFRDPDTGALLDLINNWRYASCYWADSTNPYIYPAKDTGITIDTAHMPAMAWVPFALTGDPYFLETQQAMANYAFLENPRSYEWVWQMPGSGQTRAMAWNLRTIAQAVAGTPDEVPPWLLSKGVMQQLLNQCVKGLDCIMNGETGTNRTELHCIDVGLPGFDTWNEHGVYPGSCYNHPWQTSFFCQSAAFGATLHPELHEVAGYIAKNIIARTDGKIWDASYPADYCLLLRPAYEAPWFTDWTECWKANAPLLGAPAEPLQNQLTVFGDYHGGVYAGLAALAQARSDGVTEIPAEIDATLEHFAGQMTALLNAGGDNFLTWNNSYAR